MISIPLTEPGQRATKKNSVGENNYRLNKQTSRQQTIIHNFTNGFYLTYFKHFNKKCIRVCVCICVWHISEWFFVIAVLQLNEYNCMACIFMCFDVCTRACVSARVFECSATTVNICHLLIHNSGLCALCAHAFVEQIINQNGFVKDYPMSSLLSRLLCSSFYFYSHSIRYTHFSGQNDVVECAKKIFAYVCLCVCCKSTDGHQCIPRECTTEIA